MPKILINEKDQTTAGTPSRYANYAVLITGFEKSIITADDEQEGITLEALQAKRAKIVDSNGAYEFSSAQTFKDTIGLVAPRLGVDITGMDKEIYHYGNQMAYELLKMGYSIVYKPISRVDELANEAFWEIFKDKASYDFRFITHGLLKSNDMSDNTEYLVCCERLREIEAAVEALDNIYAKVKQHQESNPDATELELKQIQENGYAEIRTLYAGLQVMVDGELTTYSDYDTARAGIKVELYGLETDPTDGLLEQISAFEAGLVTTSLINTVNGHIANLAKYYVDGSTSNEIPGRGDCIALIELDESTYVNTVSETKPENLIITAINSMSEINSANGKYCAMTVPSVNYMMSGDKAFEENKRFPGAFHYLACFMNSLGLGFKEWYAAAGYTRGVSSYVVDYTSVKLGEIAINALEPRYYENAKTEPKFACNVIACFRGSYYLWGNRTAHPLGKKGSLDTGDLVASSFLNIRQLCCTIKKQLYTACRTFTFDPNSDTLWVNFCNAIRPTLDVMKADQGIRDYKILKVYTDKKATLKAKIRIIPIEAVEDFDLEVSLEDSFGETNAVTGDIQ